MSSACARQINKINSIAMDGDAILVYKRRPGACICVCLYCFSMAYSCTCLVVYWLMLDSLLNLIIMLEGCAYKPEFPERKGRAGLALGT